MVAGVALLALYDADLIKALAGSLLILGSLIAVLDVMRRSIEKTE